MIPLKNLLSQGLVNIDYPSESRSAIEKAIVSWYEFCSLPRDIKRRFIYTDEGNLDGAGYELKEEKASTKDLKENFHVTLKAYERLTRTANEINNQHALTFIYNAHDVVELITPLVLEFADSVEKEFSLPGLVEEVEGGRYNWFLRYLHYFGNRQAGEEIASAHADKSGFTLHLYESMPGLQYLEFGQSRRWEEMPVCDGQTVIIPNMQLQYKSKGQVKALCHRVVATEQSAKMGRYSVVCFIPFLKTPMYNKNTAGRLQEFAPGFNYDMSRDKFSQLFT